MGIIRVNCLEKSLGIAKGLRFDILENGESIGNTFKVVEVIDNIGMKVYSEMLEKVVGQFKISQFVELIENEEIVII